MLNRAKKLIFSWKNDQAKLQLAFRSLLLFLSLFVLFDIGLKPSSLLFFVLAFLFAYFLDLKGEKQKISLTLLILLSLSLTMPFLLVNKPLFIKVLLSLIFTALYVLTFGIINLIFINPQFIHSLLTTFILFLAVNTITILEDISGLWISFLFIFLISSLLFYENLKLEFNLQKSRNFLLLSAILSFLLGETYIISLFLPFNFISLSSFITLVFVSLKNLVKSYVKGDFGLKTGLKELTIFMILLVLILSTATWTI